MGLRHELLFLDCEALLDWNLSDFRGGVKLRENEVLDSGVKADPREHVWTGDYQKNHWVYKLSGV